MRVAQHFAGYSLAEADNLRKACGKKDPRAHGQGAGQLRGGRGAPRATVGIWVDALFDIIEKFADYAFNKSHSYGYGLVAYQTAYLKANYPAEYLSALLTSRQERTWTRRRCTSPSAAAWASRWSCPT